MKEYQLLILAPDGNTKHQYAVMAADNGDAQRRANQFYTTYLIELWDGAHRIARIDRTQRRVDVPK